MADLFPELGPVPQEWEVRDSASGNMLRSTPDRGEALGLAAEVWRLDGDGAVGGLSVGEGDGRVFRGPGVAGHAGGGGVRRASRLTRR